MILPYKIEKLTTKRRIDFKSNREHYQQNYDELTVRLNSDPVTSLKTDIIDYSNCRQTLSDVPSLTFYRTHFSVPEIVLSLDRDMDVTRDPVKITKDMLSDNHFIGQVECDCLMYITSCTFQDVHVDSPMDTKIKQGFIIFF